MEKPDLQTTPEREETLTEQQHLDRVLQVVRGSQWGLAPRIFELDIEHPPEGI